VCSFNNVQRFPKYILDHFICKLPGSQITLDNMAEAFTMFWLMVLSAVIGHCVATTLSSEQNVDENTILDLAEKSNQTFLKLIGLCYSKLAMRFWSLQSVVRVDGRCVNPRPVWRLNSVTWLLVWFVQQYWTKSGGKWQRDIWRKLPRQLQCK